MVDPSFSESELGKEFDRRKRSMAAFVGWPQGKREQLLMNILWLWDRVEEIYARNGCAAPTVVEHGGNGAEPEIATPPVAKRRGRPPTKNKR